VDRERELRYDDLMEEAVGVFIIRREMTLLFLLESVADFYPESKYFSVLFRQSGLFLFHFHLSMGSEKQCMNCKVG